MNWAIGMGEGFASKTLTRIRLSREDLILLLSISPIVLLIMVDPNSFILGWNEGRGPILFGLIFLLLEWRDARERLTLEPGSTNLVKWSIFFSILIFYYFLVYFGGLQDAIRSWGYSLHLTDAPYLLSWTWLWEYVIVAITLAGMLASAFNIKALKSVITPIVYFVGMAIILGLDAAFPYQSLGPLASIVPLIVVSVVSLLGFSGVTVSSNPLSSLKPPWVYNQRNLLFIRGVKRSVLLEINWPCAGIMSMLIYTLVVCILMVKMDAPLKRKTLYTVLGALGTFLVNIFRIFLIALAVSYTSIDLRVFHESIGEVLFIIWIVIYLAAVISVEGRLISREGLPIRSASS